MAKKITATEPGETTVQEPPQEIPEDGANVSEALETETETQVPKVSKESKAAPVPIPEIPEHADRILKTFPSYPKLYIDFQGGTFTINTPPAFRCNATLYTNPYYKP